LILLRQKKHITTNIDLSVTRGQIFGWGRRCWCVWGVTSENTNRPYRWWPSLH